MLVLGGTVNGRRVAGRWPAALYSWLQLGRLARFEAEVCRMADAVTVVSAEDGAALAALAPGLKPMIVPNGIDLSEYQPLPEAQPSGNTIVFTGKMDYRPNLDAAMRLVNQILPRLQTGWPDIELQLVGQNPPPALLRLHAPPAITITGAVPDTRPFIAGAAVYAAPLRMGGGTRFKLLEAMALARPIVSTRLGAEGFDVETGREMLLADGAEEFAQAVLKLLNDHGKATEIGANGRRFVELNYDWRSILPRLDAVHAAVLAPCRPASD